MASSPAGEERLGGEQPGQRRVVLAADGAEDLGAGLEGADGGGGVAEPERDPSFQAAVGALPPQTAVPPALPPPRGGDREKRDDDCRSSGSIIECTNQILGETLGLAGTPFALHYRSDRVPGRSAARTLEIPLSGSTLPAGVKRVDLDVEVAGQRFNQSFAAAPNQAESFTWDGLDAYGRQVQGRRDFRASVGYVYDAEYAEPPEDGEPTFARTGTVPMSGNLARQEVTLYQQHTGSLGGWDAGSAFGLGGWSLSVHHAYDPAHRTLHLGTGERRTISDARVVTTVLGSSTLGFGGDGGPAGEAVVSHPTDLVATTALDPDGGTDLLFVDFDNCRVRKRSAQGVVSTVAGSGCAAPGTPIGDGGPATSAVLSGIRQIAVGPDGAIYVADSGHFSGDLYVGLSGGLPGDGVVYRFTAGGGAPNIHVRGGAGWEPGRRSHPALNDARLQPRPPGRAGDAA